MKSLSLRGRLVAFTMLAVFVAWSATAWVVWQAAHHELHEILDELPPALRIEVAGEHDELIAEVAEHLLQPMLIALPSLALLLWLAVALSLRPLKKVADDIAARAPDHLQPLSLDATPAEIVPLVTRLNTLLSGIDRALDNERRFTADAAHELRTPLAALKAQTQVALASTDPVERDHALSQIDLGCDRATRLVEQLLMLARLDARARDLADGAAAGLVPLPLRPLAEEVLLAAAGQAMDLACELELLDGDAVINGDEVLLRVLLRNLIENAIRHSGARQISVAIASSPERVVLTVSDDGRGIPADQRSKVLQRFYRVTSADFPASEGSGLGFSIVHRIAELHHGTVSIDSNSGNKGTRVTVSF